MTAFGLVVAVPAVLGYERPSRASIACCSPSSTASPHDLHAGYLTLGNAARRGGLRVERCRRPAGTRAPSIPGNRMNRAPRSRWLAAPRTGVVSGPAGRRAPVDMAFAAVSNAGRRRRSRCRRSTSRPLVDVMLVLLVIFDHHRAAAGARVTGRPAAGRRAAGRGAADDDPPGDRKPTARLRVGPANRSPASSWTNGWPTPCGRRRSPNCTSAPTARCATNTSQRYWPRRRRPAEADRFRHRAAGRQGCDTLEGSSPRAALLVAALAHAEVRAVDDGGTEVVLARPANRIVSLAPHLTEQLFAIGAGDRVVATTDFADYPDAARALPRVARAHHVDWNGSRRRGRT